MSSLEFAAASVVREGPTVDNERQRRYFELGEDYWWLRGKYDFLRTYLSWFDTQEHGRRRILDCGRGPGNMYFRFVDLSVGRQSVIPTWNS